MASGTFISYLRVSTDRQGKSGLGLEAQREAILQYLDGDRWELLAEYVEVESGRRSDRPQLAKALHHAKVTGSTLIIAKLDRLSRNVAFISRLMESGVEFVAVDFPQANRLTVHVLAAVAEHEREMISQRTKAALAAAKARGVKLGGPRWDQLEGLGNTAAVEKIRRDAENRAEDLREVVEDIRHAGHEGLREITRELNTRGIRTPRGGQWHPTSVSRLLTRLADSP
jgi:DNA invertase Pin-like site-specific DNA recombinase